MSELPEGYVLDNAQDEPRGQSVAAPDGFVLDAPPAPEKSARDTLGEYNWGRAALGLYDAVNLPREVYEGKVDLNTDEGTRRVLEAATVITPTTAGRFGGVAGPKPVPAPAPAQVAAPAPNKVIEAATSLSEKGAPVNVPVGLASEKEAVQAAYMRARQAPGATGVVERSLDDFYRGVEGKVDEVAASAVGGQVKDKAALGASVRTSLERAIEKSEAASDDAFKIMRRAIDPEKRVNALTDDVAGSLNKVMESRAAAGESAIAERLGPAFNILTDPKGVSFNGLQRARTQVGKAIKWDEAQGGFNAADLKQVYGALTSAMENTVRQTAKASPEGATKLWKAADARFGKMADDNKVLGSVLRKEADESLVSSIVGMASTKSGNARKLEQVLREIGTEGTSDLSGFVIQGLGQGRDGNFSALAFTNNWQKLSPTGKSQLFRSPEVRKALEDLATVTERMAEAQKKFDNSSRTGGAVGQILTSAGLATNPVQTIAGLVGANVAARALSRPATAKAMADYAKAMEVYVKRPSAGTARLAQKAAEKLSNRMAAEFGAKVEVLDLLNSDQPSARAAVEGR